MNKEEILKLNFAYIIYVSKSNPELAKRMLELHYEDTLNFLENLSDTGGGGNEN